MQKLFNTWNWLNSDKWQLPYTDAGDDSSCSNCDDDTADFISAAVRAARKKNYSSKELQKAIDLAG